MGSFTQSIQRNEMKCFNNEKRRHDSDTQCCVRNNRMKKKTQTCLVPAIQIRSLPTKRNCLRKNNKKMIYYTFQKLFSFSLFPLDNSRKKNRILIYELFWSK